MVTTTNTGGNAMLNSSLSTRYLKDAFSLGGNDAVSFVSTLVRESVNLRASDVLLEPMKNDVRVRARIDGVLFDLGKVPLSSYEAIISRMKVLSQLDPSEKRKVQEGQFTIEHNQKTINVRIEIAITIHGELIVMRIHEMESIVMSLSELGMSQITYDIFMKMLDGRSGLILVCGPTGCGKTTTLYSTINYLNQDKNFNVMTVEDPVEYHMDGINQMQTQAERGFTFVEGLKTILRLSPDIILVGEIRDKETAEIAVESGLTGQLVLSTLHADDTIGALFRILDLGIEPYLLNSALAGIVSQRLVRKVCQDCKIESTLTDKENDLFMSTIGKIPQKVYRGKGCLNCQNVTYKGRTGIFEVMKMDARIRDQVRKNINEDVLRKELLGEGYQTMMHEGLLKIEQGLTSPSEVLENSLKVF